MTEISTPLKTNLCNPDLLGNGHEEDSLSEDEQRFYSLFKNGLDKISISPRNSVIDNILNYSKSL